MTVSAAHERTALQRKCAGVLVQDMSWKGGVELAVMLFALVPYLLKYSRVSRISPLAIWHYKYCHIATMHTHALSGAAQVESSMTGSPRKALAVLLPTDHGAA